VPQERFSTRRKIRNDKYDSSGNSREESGYLGAEDQPPSPRVLIHLAVSAQSSGGSNDLPTGYTPSHRFGLVRHHRFWSNLVCPA